MGIDEKKYKCPNPGCNYECTLKDFYDAFHNPIASLSRSEDEGVGFGRCPDCGKEIEIAEKMGGIVTLKI